MKVELKAIKYFAAGSQETPCFVANIYVDGKKRGTVENEGYGGPHNIQPYALQQEIDAWVKATRAPEVVYGQELQPTAEWLISELLEDHLLRKELQALLRKRIVYVGADGKLYQTKALPKEALQRAVARPQVLEGLEAQTVLNLLPFDEALALFKQLA